MQQRSVGATGLTVSRLGLGTMSWGRETDEHEARDQLIAFAEAGGTLVDTAAGYVDGASEELRRPADRRRRRPGRDRDRDQGRGLAPPRRARDLRLPRSAAGRPRRISTPARGRPRRPVAGAHLGRRRPDRGDAHRPGPRGLERAGVVRRHLQLHRLADGPGRHVAARRSRSCRRSPRRRWSTPWSTAGSRRTSSRRPTRSASGILPWSPLGHGVLTGKYRSGIPSDSRGASEAFGPLVERYLDSRCQGIVEAVAKAADGLGWSMTEVALAWVRDRPGVTAPDRRRPHRQAAARRPRCRGPDPATGDRRRPRRRLGGLTSARPCCVVRRPAEWSGSSSRLTIARDFSRNVVTKMLVERAEHGGWELDRVHVSPDGTRRVVLRRKIIRMRPTLT